MRSVSCNLLRHIEFVAMTTIEREVERDRDLGVGPSRQSQERLVISGSHDRPSNSMRIVPHICPHCGHTYLGPIEGNFMEHASTFLNLCSFITLAFVK